MTATMTFLCEECGGDGMVDVVKSGVHDFSPYVDYYEAPCTECDGSGEIERQDRSICSWKRARVEYPDLISVEITPNRKREIR